MLGLNGGIRLWYIEGINNMRYGKYRQFCEVEALDMDLIMVMGISSCLNLIILLSAERAIRPVTVARKNSLHYSSEEGLQVALTYMTVIETVKMLGMNAKEFLVRAWREAIYGKNDMESLLQPVSVCK